MVSQLLILVTGVSGFIGAHIVDQLIKHGYRVRGTVRPSKLSIMQATFHDVYGDAVEIVAFEDLVSGDWTNTLNGVAGIIHNAAPLSGRTDPETGHKVAVEGSLNLLRSAERCGIETFVQISSTAAAGFLDDPNQRLTADTWFKAPEERLRDPNSSPIVVYAAYKTLAEQAVWAFADAHPHMNVSTILPWWCYGPFAPAMRIEKGTTAAFSTNARVYGVLSREGTFPVLGGCTDVRDAARAAVLALKVRRERIILPIVWFGYKEALEHLAGERPELRDRLLNPADAPPPGLAPPVEDRMQQVLGMDLIPWTQTLLDAVDALIQVEGEWALKASV